MRNSDAILASLDVYSADFKEQLKTYITARVYELVSGDCDSDDDAAYNAVKAIVNDRLDSVSSDISADNINGLYDYIVENIPSVDASDVNGLDDAIDDRINNTSFEVRVS